MIAFVGSAIGFFFSVYVPIFAFYEKIRKLEDLLEADPSNSHRRSL
jgi:hypothetical protein